MTREQHLKIYDSIWKSLKTVLNAIGYIARFPVLLIVKPFYNYHRWLKGKKEKDNLDDNIYISVTCYYALAFILLIGSFMMTNMNAIYLAMASGVFLVLSAINFD